MKKMILALALILGGTFAFAQTIDYTGVSIQTERAKKFYPKKMAVLLTGAGEYESYHHQFTGEVGARFVWTKHFGFYTGLEVGVQGIPLPGVDYPQYSGAEYGLSGDEITSFSGGETYYTRTASERFTRATLSVGGVMQLGKTVSLYAGSGVTIGNWINEYTTDGRFPEIENYLRSHRFEKDYFVAPTAEIGAYYFIGKVCLMTGFSFARETAGHHTIYKLNLGVGYSF